NHLVLTFFIGIIVASIVLMFIQNLIQFQTLNGVFPMRLRWWFHHMLMGQSMRFFQDEFAGRISAKVMQTSLAVREVIFSLTEIGVYLVVYFVTAGVILAGFDIRFLIPFGVWMLLMGIVMYTMVPKIGKVTQLQADARSLMTGRVTDTYSNIQTVKLFAQNRSESDYAKEAMDGFLHTVHQQMRLVNILGVIMHAINMGLILAVSIIGVALWGYSLATVGAVSASIAFALRLNSMSTWIMFEVARLFENIGIVKDGMNTFSISPEVVDVPDAKDLVVTDGAVAYNDVCFSYTKDKPIFTNFNLNIKGGEKIGLVGRSGSGKSTLINLLLRFYDVDSGTICIDGQDISQVTQESLRRNIGMVTQDTSLLHRSIRDNIRYGMSHATEEDIVRAAKQAQADDFIDDLTDKYGHTGYDTLVGERGVKLSGGQRQRISIARVLLKNAPILILDEATSALDSEVEAAIQDTLSELMQDKTVIAIAHRLSTIAAMDRLVVMDQGKIVEMGSHHELLEKNGVYAHLWARQSGGFLPEE
ncbi:MAG: ABC transporter ATP-binding protein/permease, partial [Neisseriaceae bacterium]|nr:ABC transporter ATP-binding protein/permease [Neisseriaceae bacterium]